MGNSQPPLPTPSPSFVDTLLTEPLLHSRTFAESPTVDFLFGLYNRPGVAGKLQHNMLLLTYVVKLDDCFEMRSILIELFNRKNSKRCILHCSRLLPGKREGYKCKEFFVAKLSLGAVINSAKEIIAENPEYDFVFNNCRHFSGKLFNRLKQLPDAKPLDFLETEGVDRFYHYFAPRYSEYTPYKGHISFSELVEQHRDSMETVASPSSPLNALAFQFSSSSSSSSSEGRETGIEFAPLERLRFGDVLSIPIPGSPFHHFAVYLGKRSDLLRRLRDKKGWFCRQPFLQATFNEFLKLLEDSDANEVHIDHDGHSVGIRDFKTDFVERYPSSPLRVVGFKNAEGQPAKIEIEVAAENPDMLIQAILPLLGAIEFENSCACIASEVYGLALAPEPLIPPFGLKQMEKYHEEQAPSSRTIWDLPLSDPLEHVGE